ncbi:MAG: Tll0287-like domain-containing protein [Magnetovibrionaceae bacterium]
MPVLNRKALGFAAFTAIGAAALPASADGIPPQDVTDMLHAVMESDRTIYTKMVVQRLAKKEKVLKVSEHFEDNKAAPLPAQMFRFGSEMVADKTDKFSYALLSLWPINKQNEPKTEAEKVGLQYIFDNPGENYYTEEELGGTTYFTAVYPDVAVAEACTSCHNDHKDSPKTDFEIGDTMGGVVIRLPVE